MSRGNVLVMGNSGVGKSTLINSVIGEEQAITGFGTAGTTTELSIYESEKIPFRVIDTVGFEPSPFKAQKAIKAVKKWSKESTKAGKEDTQINVIWFCVEGTSSKLFPKTIKDLSHATSMWPSVPIIVVITKSYSLPEREKNIEMVHTAFAAQKGRASKLKKVLPVVAATYTLNENAYAPPEGITELIDATNDLLPEGIKAAESDIARFKLERKRALAHGIVAAATAGGAVVGAVPIPIADAAILTPVELAEINALATIYGISKNEESKKFFNSIIEVGTVGVAAKAAISALKAIPGINIAASVLNAIIAGFVVAALGEGSIAIFEQIYLGKKTLSDIDWIKKVIESKFSTQLVDKAMKVIVSLPNASDKNTAVKAIMNLFDGSKKIGK